MAERVVYSDIDFDDESAQTDGDWVRDINTEAVKNSIRNIIRTRQGSRRMLPEFASRHEDLLFEPMDSETARRLGHNILDAIERWDNRVQVEDINVKTYPEDNQYIVDITYYILPSTAAKTTSFTISTLT